MKLVENQLKSLQNRLNQMGRTFVRVGSLGLFGGGGMGVLTGLRNIFVAGKAAQAVTWPVKLAANLEMAAAQLGTFTSNEQVARDMLLNLQKFSGVSMVSAESLSSAAAMLIRFGVAEEQVVPHTKALAVMAAGSAEEFDKLALAFAQVASAGKLQGEELRQLKNTSFNPIREIAERTGESMDEVRLRMEAGKISFQEVANALQAAVGPGGRFDGLLQRISNTLGGQFSKALAQIKLGLIPIGEQFLSTMTMIMKAVNGVIPVVLTNLNNFITTMIKNFQTLHPNIVKVFNGIANALMAGNISLAGEVLMAGLKLAWVNGTNELKRIWMDFTQVAALAFIELSFKVQQIWNKMVGAPANAISKMRTDIDNLGDAVTGFFDKLGQSEERKREIDLRTAQRIADRTTAHARGFGASDREIEAARLMAIAAQRELGREFESKRTDELKTARKELEDAHTALAAATDEAGKQAQMAQNQMQDFGLGQQFPLTALAGIDKAKDTFKQPEAFFDTRLARQMLGGPQDDQLKELRKIEHNTRNMGGLPVV